MSIPHTADLNLMGELSNTGSDSYNSALPNNREDNSISNTVTIDDLPPEVLAKIFVDSLPWVHLPLAPDEKYTPLLLCNVSSFWRHTAISTPALWNQIKIDVPTLKKGQKWEGIAWISTWLERSGATPLSISLNLDAAPSQMPKLLKLLVPHIDRWSFLSFSCTSTVSASQSYPAIPPDGACLLECINISIGPLSNPGNTKLWDWLCTFIGHSSQLHTITSCHIPSHLNWSQIRNINFFHKAGLNLSRTRDVLERASSLESANLFISQATLSNPMLLPLRHDLRRLRLVCYFPLGPLLDCLILPALRELIIKHDEDSVTWLLVTAYSPLSQHILSFLTRSSCSIVYLSLSVTTMTEDQLISCLNHPSINNSLVELSVYDLQVPQGDAFFDHLTVRESAPQILPKLEKLTMKTLMHTRDGVISQMAMSRCVGQIQTLPDGPTQAHVCQLKQLTIGYFTLPKIERPKDFAQLNALAASGLSVSFERL